jgi:hypothetical protein
MSRRTHALAAAVAVLVATPRGAVADEVVGVLAVAEPPGPPADLAAATERLRAALAASMPGVLAAADLRSRMVGPPPPATLGELRRAQAGAVAAYSAGEFDSSVRTLRAVAEALEALPESGEVFAEWTATMLRLARTEQELGHRVEAQGVLERLLRAAPDAKPDVRGYPPSFLSLVEEARARHRDLGTLRLGVEAAPGARVFVQGREVGAAPVTVALAPGRYRVAAESGGVRAPPVTADLSSEDRTVALDFSTVDLLRPDAGPGLALAGPDRSLGIVTAAARLRVDRAVTTSLLRDGEAVLLVATVHDVRRGRAEREGRIRLEGGAAPAGSVEALAAFLATGRGSSLVSTLAGPSLVLRPAPPASLDPVTLEPARPRRSRAYGWGAVGTGVATLGAAAVAVYHGSGASDRYADARGMLDASGRVRPGLTVAAYNGLIDQGDDRRRIATGATIGAAVGLAATTVLSIVSYRTAGEIGPLRF